MDDIAKVSGDIVAMARYHGSHRELVSLNDWRMAQRTTSGQQMRQFLLECAYWFCCMYDKTVVDFSEECEISVSTAIAFDRKMRRVYPETAGLELGDTSNPATQALKKELSANLLAGLRAINNGNSETV